MNNDRLVNFKMPLEEKNALAEEAEVKKYRSLSTYLRYIIRRFHKEAEVNKDGLFNG